MYKGSYIPKTWRATAVEVIMPVIRSATARLQIIFITGVNQFQKLKSHTYYTFTIKDAFLTILNFVFDNFTHLHCINFLLYK